VGFAQFEIRDQLGLMYRQRFLDRFEFDDHAVGKVQVHYVVVPQRDSFVKERYTSLGLTLTATQLEFHLQATLVNGFEQSRPHDPMNLDRRANYEFSEGVILLRMLFPVFSVPLCLCG
jgi:hypothetical protein